MAHKSVASAPGGWKNACVAAQKPLELILARNLLTSISTPSFLVDSDASVVFYNEAAAALLGRSFEDAGRMTAEEWTRAFGPVDKGGVPVQVDELEVTASIREGRPSHGRFRIRTAGGGQTTIEASAFPIVTSEHGSSGAMILFWPLSENGGGEPR
jgi:PAS domain-containing protein